MAKATGRGRPLPHECEHLGPQLVDPAEGKAPCRALCLVCGTVSPPRATSREAVRALRQMAVGKETTVR
jgi:hypothetical protein